MFGSDVTSSPVSVDEDADGSMAADDRGAPEAPEQLMPPPLTVGAAARHRPDPAHPARPFVGRRLTDPRPVPPDAAG